MKTYEQHPIGKFYPPLTDEQFSRLVEVAKSSPSTASPIYLYEGKILDGMHWYKACTGLNISPVFEEYDGDNPVGFVIRRHEGRRHLTKGQLAAVGSKLANYCHGGQNKKQSAVTADCLKTKKQISQELGTSMREIGRFRTAKRLGGELIANAIELGHIGTESGVKIAKLPRSEQPEALQKAIDSKAILKKTPLDPKITENDTLTLADNLQINDPSIFPIDAELPVHVSGDINTKYIQEAILALRLNEPLIGAMARRQMNEEIWPYTQRIQTYGMDFGKDRICGPIDKRFIQWAGVVANKVRAREAILDRKAVRKAERKEINRSNGHSPRKPKKGLEGRIERAGKELTKLKASLKKIYFGPSDIPALQQLFDKFLSNYFEEINSSKTNGA